MTPRDHAQALQQYHQKELDLLVKSATTIWVKEDDVLNMEDSKTTKLKVNSNDTIDMVKTKIRDQTGMEVHRQRFIVVDDDELFEEIICLHNPWGSLGLSSSGEEEEEEDMDAVVAETLAAEGLSRYAGAFKGIQARNLPDLTAEDLAELGLSPAEATNFLARLTAHAEEEGRRGGGGFIRWMMMSSTFCGS